MTATSTISRTELTASELRAWRGFLRAHAALTKALGADLEAEHDLPLTSYEVLLFVSGTADGRMRMCDLAESVLLSRSGLTRLIDRLEREGLIAREAAPDDARGQNAVLTDAGRVKLQAARETHLRGVRQLYLDHFTPAEQNMLGDAFERITPGAADAAGSDCAGGRTS